MKPIEKNNKNYEYEVTLDEAQNIPKIRINQSEIKENGERHFKTSYHIKNLDHDSESHVFFKFILQESAVNNKITYGKIKDNFKKKQIEPKCSSISKIISELGFKGEIKKVFFPITHPYVKFRKTLTSDECGANTIIKSFLVKELEQADLLRKKFSKTAIFLTKEFSRTSK